MRVRLHGSGPGTFPDTSHAQLDCILGPSRAIPDPIDRWENEGGQVPSGNVDRWRSFQRRRQVLAAAMAPSARDSAMAGPRLRATELHACGRCHGPIGPGRPGLLGRILNICVAVEEYHCMDAACGWSGIRLRSGPTTRSSLDRGLRRALARSRPSS